MANAVLISIRPISIHAPRGGSDFLQHPFKCVQVISIHAPRGGSDTFDFACSRLHGLFQSTLPVGGATRIGNGILPLILYFNPRSPWGERRPAGIFRKATFKISIHAPRGGSDYGM